jgi:L-rhamnose mutarotase
MVQRICWTLRVKPEKINDYREMHAEIPDYYREALAEAGWRNYSIYLMPDGLIIGYLESDDWDESRRLMFARKDVHERYSREVGDRMKDAFMWGPEGPPTTAMMMHPCEELVFRLD